jgi:hypothetical protein
MTTRNDNIAPLISSPLGATAAPPCAGATRCDGRATAAGGGAACAASR